MAAEQPALELELELGEGEGQRGREASHGDHSLERSLPGSAAISGRRSRALHVGAVDSRPVVVSYFSISINIRLLPPQSTGSRPLQLRITFFPKRGCLSR